MALSATRGKFQLQNACYGLNPSAPSCRTVLVLLSSGEDFAQRRLQGVQGFAEAVGWNLRTVEYTEDGRGRCRLVRSPLGEDIRAALATWRPDGCIIDCSRYPDIVDYEPFRNVQTVFIERSLDRTGRKVSYVMSDARAVAEVALRELMRLDYGHFAFVPHPGNYAWSDARGDAFAELVGKTQRTCDTFRPPPTHGSERVFVAHLADWLGRLPTPCGIFAANDEVAEKIVVGCRRHGMRIPEDVALVGVDDVTYVCENSSPTISSVRQDFALAGRTAATLLQDMMDHPRRTWTPRLYTCGGVVRRESTCFVRNGDRLVQAAIEFIRRHACEGIGPLDVVAELGCSRRLADLRFTRAMDHTILDEIHAVRLARVKELLRNPRIDYASLPDFCGYNSLVDLRRVFRKRMGLTMGEYRKRYI